ncbi:CRISPR-associated endonuclease Cas2 [Pediococcus pentosaceus]|uniref:CRISPR-associated endoribonuclease Cas2 n=1 Tax=Pediococcus pentosaceus TaxID=1255 RepID=A0ABD7X7E2_PEDPE|nr:CRISPR-associated endonuclease Cas2 [Pediococcus pentosaceus]AHA04655.1 CRISPR-associated protein Cas2 [Pediococcus pentosaceus SL4]AXR43098.1 CRISPR-associated endonuclease Cas2 [Pediococcus pentosaceus]KAF0518880.1 CRISPR-associated endonuclease Cas2 [Pediococcus pentosaceus]KAF0523033.1 CRISPR-associated endonuclease Cas2 [Pediococcus pentosaceus]MBF7104119.1 CRISPR-associated endonuclease Cas2 [Pediococcus pentosaceus]
MRLMIMFDLPVETAKQRKQYRQFRKSLINEGFLMIQYSVYVRVCVTKKSATLMENRIKTFLPENGTIQALTLTEKQYNDMHFLVGDRVEDVRNNSDRTVIL